MSRHLSLASLTSLALFALAAPLSAKTNAIATPPFESSLASLTRSTADQSLPGLDPASQAMEPCCFRDGCDCGSSYGYWPGYANYGYGFGYPGFGYWPGYPSWGSWPYYSYWTYSGWWRYGSYYAWNYPDPYGYWWQYPSWGYPMSTYYWWYRAQPSFVPPHDLPHGDRPPVKRSATSNSLFSDGLTAYWDGDASRASEIFLAAVRRNPNDARFWYFKALAERAAGNLDAANSSARRGAALEVLLTPDQSQLGLALERVQGADREFLHSALTVDLTPEKAAAIAAEPVKRDPTVIATSK